MSGLLQRCFIVVMLISGVLLGNGCSDRGGIEYTIPKLIKTDKIDRFRIQKIYISTKIAKSAFLVMRKYEDGKPGDILQVDAIKTGEPSPFTIILDHFTFVPGKQTVHLAVHLDQNQNSEFDESDPIADDGFLQRAVEIEVENDIYLTSVELLESTQATSRNDFKIGKIYIHRYMAKKAFLLVYADKDGQKGALLKTLDLKLSNKYNILVKLSPENELSSGSYTFHLAAYLDSNDNGQYDENDKAAMFEEKPIEHTINVER